MPNPNSFHPDNCANAERDLKITKRLILGEVGRVVSQELGLHLSYVTQIWQRTLKRVSRQCLNQQERAKWLPGDITIVRLRQSPYCDYWVLLLDLLIEQHSRPGPTNNPFDISFYRRGQESRG